MAVFNIGRKPLENGMNILGAHIDSPRIDLKQIPSLKTADLRSRHPLLRRHKISMGHHSLSLHGIVVKKDGSSINYP
ncbi:MAG: hypothetical protein ACLTK0_10310 [Anaerovoracaceae bacterium]